MEYQISCPHCGKTISNESVIDSTSKEAGLASTFVYCQCGEMITFSALITQLRDLKDPPQVSNIDLINFPWREERKELS
jgi:hypothetical protein